MNTYSYNNDLRVEAEYRSLHELHQSDKWKADKSKYYFVAHIPAYCEGFDTVVFTFDTMDELVERISKKCRDCLLKLECEDGSGVLMKYSWEKGEALDKEDMEWLEKKLGDKWKNYNYWWVLGYVYRKENGKYLSKKDGFEQKI